MSARVLVVDDVDVNVKILEAKLSASYYHVIPAFSGAEALEKAETENPDLILLDIMMPGMDGFECCRRLKANPALSHIPVVMITALDQASDRVRGLEAGADDFLTKPPNDTALFARVRSLVRVKMMIDELRARDNTFRDLGGDELLHQGATSIQPEGRVVVVDSLASRAQMIDRVLSTRLPVEVAIAPNREAALATIDDEPVDLYVVMHQLDGYDGLRLCSELRAAPSSRSAAIVVIVEDNAFDTIAAALDLGANDYIMRPIDENELVARARSQLLRKNYADRLRADMHNNLRLAVTDGLTGLYNRRYVDQHLSRQVKRANDDDAALKSVAVMLIDLDRFKSVNDTYGHPAGDAVLIELADRLRTVMRSVDLVGRFGGEEFVVVMPDTDDDEARLAAERIREAIAERPFDVPEAGPTGLAATASIGVADTPSVERPFTPEELIARADQALYLAKRTGRNRVITARDMDTGAVDVA